MAVGNVMCSTEVALNMDNVLEEKEASNYSFIISGHDIIFFSANGAFKLRYLVLTVLTCLKVRTTGQAAFVRYGWFCYSFLAVKE